MYRPAATRPAPPFHSSLFTFHFPLSSPPFLSALRHRDFRRFLTGQFISLCGTWIQTVAQGWLVLQLTDSAFAVGLVTSLGSLPILLLTLYGGVVADRVDKRRLVLVLQSLMLIEALTLGILTQLHLITVQWVMILAVFFGTLTAFEVPTRQALTAEIVAREDLMNAIALGSSAFNVARVAGPAIAGVLIATLGLAACFFANAVSYLAVIAGLLAMGNTRPPAFRGASAGEALRQGFRHMFGHPWPRALVTTIATFAVFGYSFMPMMPVFARDALRVDASGYGLTVSSVGVGATAAAFLVAAIGGRARRSRVVLGSSLLFGLVLIAAAFAPDLWTAVVLFMAAGGVMAANGIMSNTMLQTQAPDHLRGRVMGFYSFLVLGLAPVGSFQIGWVAEHFGVRTAIGIGGGVCSIVAGAVAWRMRREGDDGGMVAGPG